MNENTLYKVITIATGAEQRINMAAIRVLCVAQATINALIVYDLIDDLKNTGDSISIRNAAGTAIYTVSALTDTEVYGAMKIVGGSAYTINTTNIVHAFTGFAVDKVVAPITFNAGKTANDITAIETYAVADVAKTKYTTTAAHALVVGDIITITGIINHNAIQTVTEITSTTSFVTDANFVPDEATGTYALPSRLIVGATGDGDYKIELSGTFVTADGSLSSTAVWEPTSLPASILTGSDTWDPVNLPASILAGSVVWEPGNLADGVQESKDITVTGAALGDSVTVGAGIDVVDLIVTATVTGTDTVTIVLANETGGAIDLVSSTWTAQVVKAVSSESKDITVTGAALGDNVTVGAGVDTTDLEVSATVTAADTVTIVITNNTSTAIDLTSSTWTAQVVKSVSSESKDITVMGAVLGDNVTVGAGIDVTDLEVSATVTAADTVTIVITNNTSAAIDLASSTWTAQVVKAISSESKDFTITGAVLGDKVVFGAGVDVADLEVSATVTAADIVTVVITNNTSEAIDLASSTWKVEIIRNNDNFDFVLYKGTTAGSKMSVTAQKASDLIPISINDVATLAEDDIVWVGVTNTTGTNKPNLVDVNLSIIKL